MKNAELTKKLEDLCAEFGITIEWIPPHAENHANRAENTIWIKDIEDSGDFAAALHEIGHVMRDPDNPPQNHRERLNLETNAWQWALEHNGNDFDAEGWKRLHASLHQYYVSATDLTHPAHDLLARAEERVPTIRPRVSSFAAPKLNFAPKKSTKPQKPQP